MKKALLLIPMVLCCLVLQAQNITIEPNMLSESADLSDLSTNPGDVVGHAVVVNNSSSTKTFVWERTINDLPMNTQWASAVCDTNNCYLPQVSTREFDLGPGDEGRMDVHIYPAGFPGVTEGALPGEGEVHIRVYEKDNESNEAFATYQFTIIDGATNTKDLEIKKLRLFPNPVIDKVQISDNTVVRQVEIFNLIGERVMHFQTFNGQAYDLSELKKGMYLFRMLDADEYVLKTVKLIKT